MRSTQNLGAVTLAAWWLPVQAMVLLAWSSPGTVDAQTTAYADKSPAKPVAASNAVSDSAFTGSDQDGFHFAIEEIEGTIRLDGAYHGITRLLDKRTGRQVIDPRYSALNLFKLMSVNHVMGQPRTMERTTRTG